MVSQRLRLITLAALAVFCFNTASRAADRTYSVFDIKKTFALKDKQKTYRDYYINIGTEQGAKSGSIVAVYRRQAVVDYSRNTLHDDLLIPVAHLKIVMAQKSMSVARLESIAPARQIPVVEFNAVMLGDRVELAKK